MSVLLLELIASRKDLLIPFLTINKNYPSANPSDHNYGTGEINLTLVVEQRGDWQETGSESGKKALIVWSVPGALVEQASPCIERSVRVPIVCPAVILNSRTFGSAISGASGCWLRSKHEGVLAVNRIRCPPCGAAGVTGILISTGSRIFND